MKSEGGISASSVLPGLFLAGQGCPGRGGRAFPQPSSPFGSFWDMFVNCHRVPTDTLNDPGRGPSCSVQDQDLRSSLQKQVAPHGLEWMSLISYGLYPMAEQAPALTKTPPGTRASLGSCSRVRPLSCGKSTLPVGRALFMGLPHPALRRMGTQLHKWLRWNGKMADERAHGWSSCGVSKAGRQANNSAFTILNIMIANAMTHVGKYGGEKRGLWDDLEEHSNVKEGDLQPGSSRSATSVVIIKCCKQ